MSSISYPRNYLLKLNLLLALLFFIYKNSLEAQINYAKVMQENLNKKQLLKEKSLLMNLSFHSVGPTVMSGRVSAIDVNEEYPTSFYVGYASGGVWRTSNNGISFEPLFENQTTMTIGDIVIDWKHDEIIWVGTGENNSSRSSYAGNGVYKSMDRGKSWYHLGLENTHHIGRIVLHPTQVETIWVAAIGPLYTKSPDRGVYKTIDGGQNWRKTLFINDSTGAIDLIIDPENPNTLYAATWTRLRKAWNFNGSGKGSGIYKSTDGGENWTKVNIGTNGFPNDEGIGRIGLAVFRKNSQIIYAILDNQNRRPKEESDEEEKLTKSQLRNMSINSFLALEDEIINAFLDEHSFPKEYNTQILKERIKKGTLKVLDLVLFLEDANTSLFETPVIGAEVYKSEDGGENWKKTHTDYLDDLFYSYGYYFGQIAISPTDPDKIYTMGVPLIKSEDGGKTWISIQEENVHVDHHAIWLSQKQDGHLIVGNDGGINISYDDGKTYYKANSIPIGQFYSVNYDMETPYNIYGGLQDNGVWYGKSTYTYSTTWQQEGQYSYKRLMGGDGMQIAIDTRDNATVYTGYQFGNYFRIDKRTKKLNILLHTFPL